jgi:hypothetical protein
VAAGAAAQPHGGDAHLGRRGRLCGRCGGFADGFFRCFYCESSCSCKYTLQNRRVFARLAAATGSTGSQGQLASFQVGNRSGFLAPNGGGQHNRRQVGQVPNSRPACTTTQGILFQRSFDAVFPVHESAAPPSGVSLATICRSFNGLAFSHDPISSIASIPAPASARPLLLIGRPMSNGSWPPGFFSRIFDEPFHHGHANGRHGIRTIHNGRPLCSFKNRLHPIPKLMVQTNDIGADIGDTDPSRSCAHQISATSHRVCALRCECGLPATPLSRDGCAPMTMMASASSSFRIASAAENGLVAECRFVGQPHTCRRGPSCRRTSVIVLARLVGYRRGSDEHRFLSFFGGFAGLANGVERFGPRGWVAAGHPCARRAAV